MTLKSQTLNKIYPSNYFLIFFIILSNERKLFNVFYIKIIMSKKNNELEEFDMKIIINNSD
jgi:hypothetical protein